MVWFGDLMMLRARCDLKKGDELTLEYVKPLGTYEERNAAFIRKWGFQCDCCLCRLDRQEPKELVEERKQLVKQAEKFE
jgi:hypothetical protein